MEVCETLLNPQILYIVQIARARMESTPSKHVDHNAPLWPAQVRDKGQVK